MAAASRAPGAPRGRGLRSVAGLAALVLAAGLGACTSDEADEADLPAGPAPEASPTPEPDEAALATNEILGIFDSFRELAVEMYADPEGDYADAVSELVGRPLSLAILGDLAPMSHNDVIRVGEPTWDAEVVELELAEPAPSATVQDCFDATEWLFVDSDTGDEADRIYTGDGAFPLGRTVVVFDVAWEVGLPGGDRWRIVEARPQADEEC